MFTLAITGMAALAGYVAAVLLSLCITLGLASARPRFVLSNYRIRSQFKLVHELTWLVCAGVGGYVAARVGSYGGTEVEEKLLLTAGLLAVLWLNTWEARQRGTTHQILISAMTVAGVFLGFALQQNLAAR